MEKRLDALFTGQGELKGGHRRLADDVKLNTEICIKVQKMVEKLDANLSILVSIITEGKGAFKLFSRLMNMIKWILKYLVRPVFLLIVIFYGIAHIEHIPKWVHFVLEFLDL